MNREVKQVLKQNSSALESSDKDLRSIFEIMFSGRDRILCEDNDGLRISRHTYGEVYDKVVSAAAGLNAKIGATHGYVALEMDNCPDWIVAFWAILMSGNRPYLVNLRYPRDLAGAIIKTLGIKYTVCGGKTHLDAEPITVDSLYCDLPRPDDDLFEDEIAFSSSATSMNEVICFYTGKQISAQILNFESIIKESPAMAWHYKGKLKQLAFLPFYHVFGLFAVYFWFTFFGRTLVFLRDLSADTILKTCRRHQVTHIFAVPMLWHTVEKQVLAAVREQGEKQERRFKKGIKAMTKLQNVCPALGQKIAKFVMRDVTDKLFGRSVQFCINGGSYLRQSAMELFNGIGYGMHNGYGMSEIGITSVELRSTPKARNLNSIGHPFDSVEYRIDDDGILWVKGSSLCTEKMLNGEVITVDGWFNTEDRMNEKDGHYFILGRQSDVVIGENGENINPNTIEERFDIDGAEAISVLGLEGETGEELSLVIEINKYLSKERIDGIVAEINEINRSLSKTYSVKQFYFTYDALMPANAIKVSRKQLALKIANGEVKLIPFSEITVQSDESADSPLMVRVKEIIARVLGKDINEIKNGSHLFFDLGATSMQYFSLLTALSEAFDITSYNDDDSYCYTAKDICEYIERRM